MVANKRLLQRKPFEQRCWIALESITSLVECLLHDISHTGAMLILETENKFLKTFDLYLTQDGSVGRNCEVVWQSGREFGVKFVGRAVPFRAQEGVEATMVIEA